MTSTEPVALPLTRQCPYAPPPEHLRLRDEQPVARVRLPSGMTVWALTRHEDIRAMLTDPRFSSDRNRPGFPAFTHDPIPVSLSLLGMDPPEHGPARRAVMGEFTLKRITALHPRIQQIVDERVDALLAGPRPVDLVPALSLPVPSLVTCELLGVPYAEHDFFQSRSATLLSRGVSVQQIQQALGELLSYLDRLIAAKEQEPTDDLLGRQVRRQQEQGPVDHEALVSLAFLLLVAGHETTANMISLGVLALLDHPEDLAVIRRDPSRTPDAVEELLRWFTIAELGTSRVALEDVEIGGVLVRAGDGVLGLSNTADRDPEVFTDPGSFDIDRGGRHHLAFGYGPHQCLGQHLARLELQIVLDTLFRRIPHLRCTVPVDELPFKNDADIYGLHELPVTW
ncbi:cytochrome P450 [Kocuria sp. SM24M-10]|uniref:cytochrome P450 n=1 Tax=Kocuria sp. SM24M-10 TaxID=1660349 RepID=UPI00064AA490|nr:cytochrome P450 [Kocuria sp. SM24M-10]KLU11471.1 cytochrome P450 [Kocuria sp. SM24M-10]